MTRFTLPSFHPFLPSLPSIRFLLLLLSRKKSLLGINLEIKHRCQDNNNNHRHTTGKKTAKKDTRLQGVTTVMDGDAMAMERGRALGTKCEFRFRHPDDDYWANVEAAGACRVHSTLKWNARNPSFDSWLHDKNGYHPLSPAITRVLTTDQ